MKFLTDDREKIEAALEKLYRTVPIPVPCDLCAIAHHYLCNPCTKRYKKAAQRVKDFYRAEGIIG
jgi:hypothetical protein